MTKDDALRSTGTMITTISNTQARHAPRRWAKAAPLPPLSHLSNTGDVASCAR
jgi:hypothetical protein